MSAILSAGEAQRLTQRIKLTASGVRDGLFKLRNLVDEAKNTNVWQVLGFPSWTSYLADTLGEEPLRLGREERQELVGYLAGEGMSTRAIEQVTGASHGTVVNDIKVVSSDHLPEPVRDDAPEYGDYPTADPVTGEVIDAELVEEEDEPEPVRVVAGLDGKEYKVPAPKQRAQPLGDAARSASADLARLTDRIRRIVGDQRYRQNRDTVISALHAQLKESIATYESILTEMGKNE